MRNPIPAAPALALALAATAHPATAAENRVVTCDTWKARAAPAPAGAALNASVPAAMAPISLNSVQFTDRRLGRRLVVAGVQAVRSGHHGLIVHVRLVNCRSQPLAVQLRSHFLDAGQLPTEPASAWRTLFLSPRATAAYQESSWAGPRVAAFLVELRPAPEAELP
ncbi:MAG: hypothetical protein KGQ52_09055 [Alphaproteobacteria bacterium]|nr:hypothetical protein [Alphaproteobacteria bacterium]